MNPLVSLVLIGLAIGLILKTDQPKGGDSNHEKNGSNRIRSDSIGKQGNPNSVSNRERGITINVFNKEGEKTHVKSINKNQSDSIDNGTGDDNVGEPSANDKIDSSGEVKDD